MPYLRLSQTQYSMEPTIEFTYSTNSRYGVSCHTDSPTLLHRATKQFLSPDIKAQYNSLVKAERKATLARQQFIANYSQTINSDLVAFVSNYGPETYPEDFI